MIAFIAGLLIGISICLWRVCYLLMQILDEVRKARTPTYIGFYRSDNGSAYKATIMKGDSK